MVLMADSGGEEETGMGFFELVGRRQGTDGGDQGSRVDMGMVFNGFSFVNRKFVLLRWNALRGRVFSL